MPRGTPSIPTLIAHGSDLLRQYVETESKRTETLRTLARTVVGIRAQTLTPKGDPDWAGQSQTYRDHIRAMYDGAGIPTDASSNVQAALRYHIGEVLRDVATPQALTKAGLATKGPKDRATSRATERATQAAVQATQPTTLLDAIRQCADILQRPYPDPEKGDLPNLTMGLLTLEALTVNLRQTLLQTMPEAPQAKPGSVRNPRKAPARQKVAA